MDLDHPPFDVIVVGCGLAESIAAASLAHSGKTVLHVDENEYYGGDHASLSLGELVDWARTRSSPPSSDDTTHVAHQKSRHTDLAWSFTSTASTSSDPPLSANPSLPPTLKQASRNYSLSLAPSIVPSVSPLIETLVASGVSRYSTFRMMESTAIFDAATGTAKKVPGSKEDVFKDKKVGLVDKRRLMKALLWAMGEFEGSSEIQGNEQMPMLEFLQSAFSLSKPLAEALTFALAHCTSASSPALLSLIRGRTYLRSVGKYGNSAFLVGQYGGAGEIAQGFCRLSAVHGSIYILSHPIISIDLSTADASTTPHPVSLQIKGFTHPILASQLITSPDYLPPSSLDSNPAEEAPARVARCIAILDSYPFIFPLPATPSAEDGDEDAKPTEVEKPDASLLVFPPRSLVPECEQTVQALIVGEGTGSCPRGQYVLYLTLPLSPSALTSTYSLLPFLDRILAPAQPSSPPITPIFTLHYTQTLPSATPVSPHPSVHIVRGPSSFIETPEMEEEAGRVVKEGERLFWEVFGRENATSGEEERGFFVPAVEAPEGEEDE